MVVVVIVDLDGDGNVDVYATVDVTSAAVTSAATTYCPAFAAASCFS
nr:hypothetical protein [Kofleriaceae bacterium]